MSTRPKISWSDLATVAVGLWGLGVEGRANLAKLKELGSTPVLVDDQPPVEAANGLEVLATADGGLEALGRCDVVVKTPGISRYRTDVVALEQFGVRVVGGMGLWMEEADRARVACITGTKGKSTTAAITGHLLERLGYRCLVGGNLGVPPWAPGAQGQHDFWVVETSSFQATDLASSPPTVGVTALAPDHLDWHGSVERYYADKLSATSLPGAELTIADDASAALKQRADLLGPRVEWVRAEAAGTDWSDALGLLGVHNRRNAHIARAILIALGVTQAHDDDALIAAAEGFDGLESRLRAIGTVGAVSFVDDSLSTNVLPTIAALNALMGRRVALLVGGHDRGIDYQPLAERLAASVPPTLVVTMPDNGARIGRAVTEGAGDRTEVVHAPDLDAAVRVAFEWAKPDGVVLLSPAAPSFGRFSDYRQRAQAFAVAMRSCGWVTTAATGRSG